MAHSAVHLILSISCFFFSFQRAGLGFLRTEQYLKVLAKEEQGPVLFPS